MNANFKRRVRDAIGNAFLQEALSNSPDRWRQEWGKRQDELASGAKLRERAQEIRRDVIENLNMYVDQFTSNLQKNGIHVHRASDAANACSTTLRIARSYGAKLVTKSKSMLTEEIELNSALSKAGIWPVETDLGEFIIQLRGETPAHIVAPAIHLRREDVAETFSRKLGMTYTKEIEAMTLYARAVLREKFLNSEVGISGVNFGVAETGTICLVTNEGNGRMVTTIPPVHIAIMGLERILPTLDDLGVMLQLLPRACTGQKITAYVSLIQAPRREGDSDGPQERHLILVDNGRQDIAGSSMSEILHCIRCGACLNVCPVYRQIGGQAYASPYSGPIGAVVSPHLFGLKKYGHLALASTLCGACHEVCPVNIDLPRYLLRIREKYTQEGSYRLWVKWILMIYEWLILNPKRFSKAQRLGARLIRFLPRREGWYTWAPPPFSAWTRARYFPPLATQSFRQQVRDLVQERNFTAAASEQNHGVVSAERRRLQEIDLDLVRSFSDHLIEVGGEFIECNREVVNERVVDILNQLPHRALFAWDENDAFKFDLLQLLQENSFELVDFHVPVGMDKHRRDSYSELATADIGITVAFAGLADTGTIVHASGRGRSQLASLLPPVHIAILSANRIYPTMEAWLQDRGKQLIKSSSCLSLTSGPSKTADIESTLTLGVHGPARVIVVCVQ
jgi:L-lactate dehydrogenase complex protein LldF